MQLGVYAVMAAVAVVVVWQLLSRTGNSRLRIDSTRITTGVVAQGTFREYYPFDGSVEPATSVYLDIEEGGRVEKIFAEGGAHVEKGDLILRFSNAEAQRTSIETETRLLETLDTNRNTEFNSARSSLLQQEALLDLDHEIIDAQAKFNRYDALMKSPDSPISREQYETARDQINYLKQRRALLAERIRQEDILSANQLDAGQEVHCAAQREHGSAQPHRAEPGRARADLRLPVDHRCAGGPEHQPGQRIGQIDLLDKFKIRARIDQLYISRVVVDTPGHVSLDGKTWDVKVQKVYPEVKNSLFEADVVFTDSVPDTLKRGQTVTVELSFGAPTQTLMVAKGGYYQQTGGRWVYLVAKDGQSARRTEVRLGRQNPRQVEVLEGLTAGDRIITSGYDSYNNADELKFSDAIKTTQEKT